MSVIDWSKAAITETASHHEASARIQVIVIPREVFAQWMHHSWDEIERAAFIGLDGLAPLVVAGVDAPDPGLAFMRAADTHDRSLQGRAVLYMQGW